MQPDEPPAIIIDDEQVIADVDVTSFPNGAQYVISFPYLLPPEVEVRVMAGQSELGVFSTGAAEDLRSPEWDGSYRVQSDIREGTSCGDLYAHEFTFENVVDDNWAIEELLSIALPTSTGVEARGNGTELLISNSLCSVSDPSLEDDFDRKYMVRLVDGAGNATERFPVCTRGSRCCGCVNSGGSESFGAAAMIAVLAVCCRRRRRRRGLSMPNA